MFTSYCESFAEERLCLVRKHREHPQSGLQIEEPGLRTCHSLLCNSSVSENKAHLLFFPAQKC